MRNSMLHIRTKRKGFENHVLLAERQELSNT
jgi:hypothetical protein